MRITGGTWGSRLLQMPKSELVRPTQDRVREALFSMLMYDLPGARFLDLFAGTGAVGLDALSRGASYARFVEGDKKVFATLQKNLATFGVDTECAVQCDVLQWLERPLRLEQPYNIIFADPPYRWAAEGGLSQLVDALLKKNLIAQNAVLVFECDYRTDAPEIKGYTCTRDRLYGKTRLALFTSSEV